MNDDLLKQAVELINAGNPEEAYALLIDLVTQEPGNETALLWLAACAETKDEKIEILQKILDINPDNRKALDALQRLTPDDDQQPSIEDIIQRRRPPAKDIYLKP